MIYEIPELWVAAVAAFIPVLTAAAVRVEGSNAQRALVAVIASAVLALVDIAIGDGATIEQYISTFATVVATEFVAFAAIWGPIVGINNLGGGFIGGTKDADGMSAG